MLAVMFEVAVNISDINPSNINSEINTILKNSGSTNK